MTSRLKIHHCTCELFPSLHFLLTLNLLPFLSFLHLSVSFLPFPSFHLHFPFTSFQFSISFSPFLFSPSPVHCTCLLPSFPSLPLYPPSPIYGLLVGYKLDTLPLKSSTLSKHLLYVTNVGIFKASCFRKSGG